MVKKTGLFLLIAFFGTTGLVFGQGNNDFQIANRLMQQQRYEDAQNILERITRNEPGIFLYFDRLIECYIQLKKYDEGIQLVERKIQQQQNIGLSNILLGQLYHFKGDTTIAYEIWKDNLAENPTQLQLYVNTANAMTDRRDYKKAVDVYLQARAVFGNNQMFMTEIPNTYMQAGEYELAIREWIKIILQNPQQVSGLQRLLLRYDDPLLYDISVLELEDTITDLPLNDPIYSSLNELQVWLLLENKLYRRAYATARDYESRTSNFNFSLFNVGRRLSENSEFELALNAFNYYSDNSFGEIKWRALEEKAEVYTRWAKYLDDYSLDFTGKKDSLYYHAVAHLDSISAETSTYSRIHRVYLKQAELALDFVFNLEEAEKATAKLKTVPDMNDTPESNYLDGRIFLAKKEFTSARISLTRANKKAGTGEIAEKTRYFLALTDFYAGDFEFAKIQLKSLGRQNTSFYANDALELRLWVQEGLAADSNGSFIKPFADAHYKMATGQKEAAEQEFLAIANSNERTPFKDDSFILLSSINVSNTEDYLDNLSNYLATSPYISVREKILWIMANTMDEIYQSGNNKAVPLSVEDRFFGTTSGTTLDGLIKLYEDLILEYPQGFYAPYARKRLGELPKANS